MAELRLKNVCKRWGDYVGVDNFDLTVADREFLVLLGPSGCGKTTTMRMIAGLEDVTDGEIWFGDKMVNDLEPKDRDISMVFQSYGLYPNMSVYENIRFPLRVRGVPVSEHRDRVLKAAKMVELMEFLDRRPAALSGGQRQRVPLGRAIVRRPNVFLMDEPLSNLDAKLRKFMRAELKRLQGDLGTTTIYVTHDQIEAMTLAHRVAVMNKGVVQQIATPREIYDDPANLFVAGFIGSPPMNVLPGAVADGAFVLPEGRVALAGFGPRKDAVFGFRPEDARVTAPEDGDLKATIYASELTGNETVVTCQVGREQVVVKTDKGFDLAADTPIGLAIDRAKLRLFDAETGERIVAGGG